MLDREYRSLGNSRLTKARLSWAARRSSYIAGSLCLRWSCCSLRNLRGYRNAQLFTWVPHCNEVKAAIFKSCRHELSVVFSGNVKDREKWVMIHHEVEVSHTKHNCPPPMLHGCRRPYPSQYEHKMSIHRTGGLNNAFTSSKAWLWSKPCPHGVINR